MRNLWAGLAYGMAAAGTVGLCVAAADRYAESAARHLGKTVLTSNAEKVRPKSRVEKRRTVLLIAHRQPSSLRPSVHAMTPPEMPVAALAAALDRADAASANIQAPLASALSSQFVSTGRRSRRSGAPAWTYANLPRPQMVAMAVTVSNERKLSKTSANARSSSAKSALHKARAGTPQQVQAVKAAKRNAKIARLNSKALELAVFKSKTTASRNLAARLAETPGYLMYDRFIRRQS